MRRVAAALLAALIAVPWPRCRRRPARAERLIASLSSHRVQITSIFTGVELVLFGTIEPEPSSVPRKHAYDIIATVTGPRADRGDPAQGAGVRHLGQRRVAHLRRRAVLPGGAVDAAVASDFANEETQRRLQIGLAHTLLPQQIGPDIADVVVDDQFRQAFLRIKQAASGSTANPPRA